MLNLIPRFAGNMEAQFRDSYFSESLKITRVALISTGLLYAIFGFLDTLMIKSHLDTYLFIRFGIVVPVIASVVLASFHKEFKRVWQLLLFMACFIGGLGIIFMIRMHPANGSYYGGLMLVLSACYFFLRLRYLWASFCGWLLLIAFNIVIVGSNSIDQNLLISYNFFYVSANLIGTVASYFIEMSYRKNFHLNAQLEEKKNEAESINKNLEELVVKRTLDLQESEERFRSLAELLPLMVYEVNPQGRITYANQQAYKLMGFEEEVVKQNPELSRFLAAEDRNRALHSFKSALKRHGISKGEYRLMRADGTVFPVLDYSSPIIREGEVVGLRSVVVDISDQKYSQEAVKASEARYRALAENAFDGIFLANTKGFLYVNRRFCEITGYDVDFLLNTSFDWKQLLTSESVTRYIESIESGRKFLDSKVVLELQVITKDGDVRDVELSMALLEDNEEKSFLGVVRDVTERKHNLELRNQVVVARQSAEFKQQFLANMSHEIRTPLTGIMGMTELLTNTHLDETQLDYLNTLRHSTSNLKEIINQILDYSRIEAGKVSLKHEVIQTNRFFENSLALFQSVCQKPIELIEDVSDQLPECIIADKQKIQQILSNLLFNAVKFTQSGYVALRAEQVVRFGEGKLMVKIEVEDSGLGIQKDKQDLLFQPFFQVDHKDTRSFEGTGLGLSICRELTYLLGGSIGVESEPGKGSRFWFTFLATEAPVDAIQEESKPAKPFDGKLRILLVEDKWVNQKVISLQLKSMGHEVSTANDGAHALEVFKPGEFDLILMDIQMPVMDGITATQKLKTTYSALPPIVGLSANAFEGDREKYMKLGMDEYITKPLITEDFILLTGKLFA